MIAYIKGEVAWIEEERIVLESGNIGYNIMMPASSFDTQDLMGNEVKIYTHLNVREDAMQLYGFLNLDELKTFRLLLGVNGIGPKAALGILSGLTTDELRFAVLSDDVKTISKAPGIGKKTAQKLILELKVIWKRHLRQNRSMSEKQKERWKVKKRMLQKKMQSMH